MLPADGPFQRENEIITGLGKANHLLHLILAPQVQENHDMEISIPSMTVHAGIYFIPLEELSQAFDVPGKIARMNGRILDKG